MRLMVCVWGGFKTKQVLKTDLIPVNNAKGMQIAQCQGHLRCIERSPGLRKGPLPLEVVEELRR